MKRFFAFVMLVVATMFLVSCGGKGSSASAPTGVTVVPGDTNVTVSWNAQPGVEYWIYDAPGGNFSLENCANVNGCSTSGIASNGASSPTVINLRPTLNNPSINGTTYSFTINGRTGGGPGGPGSPFVSATPRLAGGNAAGLPTYTTPSWSVGTATVPANDLHGVAYGYASSGASSGTYFFVAVGANGVSFSSVDGKSWTAMTNPIVSPRDLNAVSYYGGKFVAVGLGGVILLSTDAVTWTQDTSGTTNDLYAISNYGYNGFVATGVSGTVLTGDGTNWALQTSVTSTSNTLYGVTYVNGLYVAVGAAGTLLTSTNVTTAGWTNLSPLGAKLKGVACGLPLAAYGYVSLNATVYTCVAVGDTGSVVTSVDGGASWSTQGISGSPMFNAVTFGHQFIAVDTAGSIFTSTDGLTWTAVSGANNPNTNPLYAVTPAQIGSGPHTGLFVYSVVGASGVNMQAQ